jgi:serine-type D-Ala-D-Ala carboxypeptidase/endopeptidase
MIAPSKIKALVMNNKNTSLVLALLLCSTMLNACGGGSDTSASTPPAPSPASAWAAVDSALAAAATQFPTGITLEIATEKGVVYSKQIGNFSNETFGEVASASKWVSSNVLMRLVDQGVLDLGTKTKEILTDENGQPWGGNLGETTLRDLLSFQTGIATENQSAVTATTLTQAVNLIYAQDGPSAKPTGTFFSYLDGSNSFRIAARMAEVKTGKTWAQLFAENVRDPLGWSASSAYSYTTVPNNPNPSGGLMTTGKEYMRLLVMQLNKGTFNGRRFLSTNLIDEQRKEQWRESTTIFFSPYTSLGKSFHYGLGQWRECDTPSNVASCDAALRVGSTGAFGFAPWIDVQRNYAAIIMTRQPGSVASGAYKPSEDLKFQLAPLIPAALAQNPPVIRPVP